MAAHPAFPSATISAQAVVTRADGSKQVVDASEVKVPHVFLCAGCVTEFAVLASTPPTISNCPVCGAAFKE